MTVLELLVGQGCSTISCFLPKLSGLPASGAAPFHLMDSHSLSQLIMGLDLKMEPGISLVAQWLRLRAPSAGGLGPVSGQGTRSHMHAATKEVTCRN